MKSPVKYMRFDDQIVEVSLQEGKFVTKVLSKDEMAEAHLLGEIKDNIATSLQRVLDETREDIKTSFKEQLKANVLKVIGFSNSWGKWEVDHCNGRMSTITELVAKEAREFVAKEVANISKVYDDKEIEAIRALVKKEMKDRIARISAEEAEKMVRSRAQNELAVIVEEAIQSSRPEIHKHILEKLFVTKKEKKHEVTLNDDGSVDGVQDDGTVRKSKSKRKPAPKLDF